MATNVAWTRRAESHLGTSLCRMETNPSSIDVEMTNINRQLADAFPQSSEVIVIDHYVGFMHRRGEHILRVDVRKRAGSHTYVVKLADHERLSREQSAWGLCHLTDTNPVFMPLVPCLSTDEPGKLIAIAYQDAESHIGTEECVWLETAIANCVRFDSPNLHSILNVLHDIYSQLRRLHRDGQLVMPTDKGIETIPVRTRPGDRHRLTDSLEKWEKPKQLGIRRQVNAAFTVGSTHFLDPVDYYRFLGSELDAGVSPESVLPQVMRGLAHGDLHGRNSLVGIDDNEFANFPTLFDYESIHPDNLVGWDFVEMETELKIRIYDHLIPRGNLMSRARHIQEFEWELAEATRRCIETKNWPGPADVISSPRDRLTAIVLAIRHEACQSLGMLRAESVEWFHEYCYLLGCYCLTSVRYENQTEFQRSAVYIAAGVAAAAWEQLRGRRIEPPHDVDQLLSGRHPTYHVPLAVARSWNRSKIPDERLQAERLLTGLAKRYPTALHVSFERAFNFTKQPGRLPDALRLLEVIHTDFEGRLDEDTFCLWGRYYKDPGDQHMAAGQKAAAGSPLQQSAFEEADDAYRQAIVQYEKAFEVAQGFFPGINVATLTFLRAGLCASLGRQTESQQLRLESQKDAQKLLDTRQLWRKLQPDDEVWTRATQAEAAMLMGSFEYAIDRYQSALRQPLCQDHHPQSMGTQLRRILDGYRLLNEPVDINQFSDLTPLIPFIK